MAKSYKQDRWQQNNLGISVLALFTNGGPGMTLTDGGIDEAVVDLDVPTRTSFSIPESSQRPALRKEYNIAASVGDDQAYHNRGQEPSQPALRTDPENVKTN